MVDISSCLSIPGWMNDYELLWLAETAQRRSRIIEVGSWCGRSTRALALHTKGVLWAVDPWEPMEDPAAGMTAAQHEADLAYNMFIDHMRPFEDDGRLYVLREDGKKAAETLKRLFGHGSFDFIFIDGDHSYEAVRADITNFLPLLAQGGTLAGHDNWMTGVRQAIEELVPGYQCPAGSIWVKQT